MRRSSEETREHVLSVAKELFYRDGIGATGVDSLARSAGVAPTTLYRLFRDKDDLVASYVTREGERYQEWFDQAAARGDSPAGRIRSVFEALAEQVGEPTCRGCVFQLGMAELAQATHPGHAVALALKKWNRQRFRELARELPDVHLAEADRLGDELFLLAEGVYASVLSLGPPGLAARALEVASRIVGP